MHTHTSVVKGVRVLKNGLYYLADTLLQSCNSSQISKACTASTDYELWHNRLGNAPLSKMRLIGSLQSKIFSGTSLVCLTCSMTRFTKLPFTLSSSHASEAFALLYVDIWGPYIVCTRGKYKYFLELIDDCTRMIWVYRLQSKSGFLQCFKGFAAYVDALFLLTSRY